MTAAEQIPDYILATEVSETETVTAILNPNGTIRSFITDKD